MKWRKIAKAVRRVGIKINNNEIFFVCGNCFQFRDNIVDELGDVLWFVAMMARRLGFSLEDLMSRSIEHKRFEQLLDERASRWGKDKK